MTFTFFDNLKAKINNIQVFGWSIADINSLLRFSIHRIMDGELAQVAGSLTFITVLSLVPMLALGLALFTAFPLFTDFREALEAYFIQNLMPKDISITILNYLNQFAAKATSLSAYSAIALMATAVITLATIERVFNQIWRIKQTRPLINRMLVYWALVTLAPLLIGVSLTVTSYLYAATTGVIGGIPPSKTLYTLTSVIFTTGAFGLLYVVVPNRRVDWRDAVWGGLVAGILFEIAKRIFAAFVIHIPTYTVVFGALAVVPIFLIWIYTSWLIILFGGVITASLPVVKYERWWHVSKPGSRFIDAMALLKVLCLARAKTNQAGISSWEIRRQTGLGLGEIESLLMPMMQAGWVGRLDDADIRTSVPLPGAEWWVLLANPSHILMAQVYRLFLFEAQSDAADARLAKKVETAIEQGLQESLEDYFLE